VERGAFRAVPETKGDALKLIDRLPEILHRRSRRISNLRQPHSAECLDVRLNLSVLALDSGAFCLDEQFDDEHLSTDLDEGSEPVTTDIQSDVYFDDEWTFEVTDIVYIEDAFADELFDDSLWTTDFLADEDFYFVDDSSEPFTDDVYYEWYDLNGEYAGDIAWSDDFANSDQWFWDEYTYWEWTYEEETDELIWYVYDTTIVDDSFEGFDDGSYFADSTADGWFEVIVEDSASSLTSIADASFGESTVAESDGAADSQSTVDSSTAALVPGVQRVNLLASQFATAVIHARSATGHVHAEVGIADTSARWQNAGSRMGVASKSLPAGRTHQTQDFFGDAESFRNQNDTQRRDARSDGDFDGAVIDRTELIGRLDQLFKEFSHANGVASDFDKIELAVTYPGQRGARLLELSSVSDGDAHCNGKSARVSGTISLQNSPERLGSHEAVGAIVAAGLVGAAIRSGWMLRRRRECDLQVTATGQQNF